MLLTKMRNSNMPNDTIAVGARSYKTDGKGVCAVHPADVSALRACDFEAIGEVESEKKNTIRLPSSKEEFLDLAFAIGLTAIDLHSMARLLEPPAAEPEVAEEPEPVTTYVAPPPANQPEMITVPPDDENKSTGEIEVAPEPEPPQADDEGKEVTISMEMSKPELLEIGISLGLPVKPAMRKREIYNEIVSQSQRVDHEHQNVQ